MKIRFLFWLSLFFLALNAQEPVTWQTSFDRVSPTEVILQFDAQIAENWHLYTPATFEDGPLPTELIFSTNSLRFELDGDFETSLPKSSYDAIFQIELPYFDKEAQFSQKIKLLDEGLIQIEGEISYQACDDKVCIFRTEPFQIRLDGSTTPQAELPLSAADQERTAQLTLVLKNTAQLEEQFNQTANNSLFNLFLLGFFGGLLALLTPCVFPMIPLTVSFFTKQSKNRSVGITNAIIFGVSIVVIYVLLGTVVTAIFGAGALNALSTNVWFNLAFFILLVVFAISFLGAFEITLPSSWGNKADEKANKGGLVGIFFMALALAIVSFSCTGPIVGTILVQAASGGNQLGPVVGMLGFSLAIALPFTLFAAFPGWMNSLPKSGGWLNTVKVVLGFLELAFAFKFLSNADLVLQLHLFEREVFLALWIAIFGALSLYLFGKIQLPHDSKLESIAVGRLLLGLLSLSFTIYMIPGLWGAPLKLISAFPPPQHYSESPYGVGNSQSGGVSTIKAIPEGAHLMAPHNIVAFNDYDLGMAYAKSIGKPVLIDFTGHACVNCRKMEQNVWVDDRVLGVLKNDVVLISLYVDDKRALDSPIPSTLRPGKQLRTIGQKWAEFQAVRFKANSQPFYVILDSDGKQLGTPVAYTPDADAYHQWLQAGIK